MESSVFKSSHYWDAVTGAARARALLIASFITGFHIRQRAKVLRRRHTVSGTALQSQQSEAANGVYGDRANERRIEARGFALHEIMVSWDMPHLSLLVAARVC